MKRFLSIVLLTLSAHTYADVKCSDLMSAYQNVGTTCLTSKGVSFQRVQDENGLSGWKEISETGIVWFDRGQPIYASSYIDNLEVCESRGLRLPSAQEASSSIANGLNELLGIRYQHPAINESKLGFFKGYLFTSTSPQDSNDEKLIFELNPAGASSPGGVGGTLSVSGTYSGTTAICIK